MAVERFIAAGDSEGHGPSRMIRRMMSETGCRPTPKEERKRPMISGRVRALLVSVVFAFVFLPAAPAGMGTARAAAVSDTTLFGTWKLEYATGDNADGLNATIEGGTRIYYIFTDDEVSGLSIAPDGSTDTLAKRAYTVSDGKLLDGSGDNTDIALTDGVLSLTENGTQLLLDRADLEFLMDGTWNYVAMRDDTQPEAVQNLEGFIASGGVISFTFGNNEVTIATTENGSTSARTVPYIVEHDNVIRMFDSSVEVLIADDRMILTDGTTWQYYEKAGTAGSSAPAPAQGVSGNAAQLDLQWDPNHNDGKGGYILLVNGNALTGDQDLSTAVSFCNRNGIQMETYDNGNGHSGEQEIVFAGILPLMSDYAFYVDQGAGEAEGKLRTVRMYFAMNEKDTEAAAQQAQEVYQKLVAAFGEPTDSLMVYSGSDLTDADGNDMYSAVKQMLSVMEDNYAFAGAKFSNMTLYVPCYDGAIDIYLNFSIF